MTAILPVSVESEIFYPSAKLLIPDELAQGLQREIAATQQERQRAEQAQLQIEQLKPRLRSAPKQQRFPSGIGYRSALILILLNR